MEAPKYHTTFKGDIISLNDVREISTIKPDGSSTAWIYYTISYKDGNHVKVMAFTSEKKALIEDRTTFLKKWDAFMEAYEVVIKAN
jgi:hypothetical protein